jgi:hypothetical protein
MVEEIDERLRGRSSKIAVPFPDREEGAVVHTFALLHPGSLSTKCLVRAVSSLWFITFVFDKLTYLCGG